MDRARSVLSLASRAGENAADVLAQCVATEAAASRSLDTVSELARRLGVADDSAESSGVGTVLAGTLDVLAPAQASVLGVYSIMGLPDAVVELILAS